MARRGNNERSIYKDKQGRWRGLVSLPSVDGKYKRKYVYGKSRKEVSEKVNELLRQLQEAIKGHRLKMPILLALYTGVRQGELLGLPWKNVHLELNGQSYIRITQTLNRIKNPDHDSPNQTILQINEPKTAYSVRTIPLLPTLAEKLARYREAQINHLKANGYPSNGFVFTTTIGTVIEPRDFQRDFKKILIQNGIRVINVHGLRHTFATRNLESGNVGS